jgi:hypothetical protein
MAVRTPRAARRRPQLAAPPAERQPARRAATFPQRGRAGHPAPAALAWAAGPPAPRVFPDIRPPRGRPGSRPEPKPPTALLAHRGTGTPGNRQPPALASQGKRLAQRRMRSRNGHPRGPCPWPSVEKPTVCTDRSGGPDAVRYTSVDTATHRRTVTHCDTRRDKNKTAPRARFRSQGAVYADGGRCWVRTSVDIPGA